MRVALFFIILAANILSHASNPPIAVDEAFAFASEQVNKKMLLLKWSIKKGHYLYKYKIKLTNLNNDRIVIQELIYPKATKTMLSRNILVPVYSNSLEIQVLYEFTQPVSSELKLEYQGCAASGYCYPPQERIINLKF